MLNSFNKIENFNLICLFIPINFFYKTRFKVKSLNLNAFWLDSTKALKFYEYNFTLLITQHILKLTDLSETAIFEISFQHKNIRFLTSKI
jgi:hypothetical protein